MPGYIEERLKHDLRVLTKVYIEAFPFSYARFVQGPADFMDDLKIYENIIETNYFDIRRAAATGVQNYCALYEIMPVNGVDEFKSIYYLGRAIEAHLLAQKHIRISQVHMFTMIGLLDEKLQSLGVFKDQLTVAMTGLVRAREFDNELGKTGCYLIYKCSSTAPKHSAPAQGKL